MTTTGSLFTGGGGFEVGAIQAGYTPVWGVEIRPDIAAVAEKNIPGLKVIVSDVATVDYASLPKVDHLHASPSCKKASIANSDGGECEEDIAAALAVCRAIREVGPENFTLENVWGYREFEAFKLIVGQLTRLGYKADWWHLNAANYGVPQTRKRLILIARKDRQPTRPQPTHSKTPDMFGLYKPWVGWYEAIIDLIPGLPETKPAPWQLSQLPEKFKTILLAQGSYDGEVVNRGEYEPAFTITANSNQGGLKAFIMDGQGAGKPNGVTVRHAIEPMFTVTDQSKGVSRAFVVGSQYGQPNTVKDRSPQARWGDEPYFTVTVSGGSHNDQRIFAGRWVGVTPQCLTRFQSFPGKYELPELNGLACEIIGNAVAPLLAKAICESLR